MDSEAERSEGPQVFLVMNDVNYRYCLYRIKECEGTLEEANDCSSSLDEPLLKLEVSEFPPGMSFATIGRHIFMVGGYDKQQHYDKVFIYDIQANSLVQGPSLISGKSHPYLLTLGSKIFALSNLIFCYSSQNPAMDPKPRFEVLDTDRLQSGWSGLPVPRLYYSKQKYVYSVDACAGVCIGGSNVIVISVGDAGTYVFEVENLVWKYVRDEPLPFTGHAKSMFSRNLCDDSSLCFACSTISKKLSAFRIRYCCYDGVGEDLVFSVDEIPIDKSGYPTSPLPPQMFPSWTLTIPFVVCDRSISRIYSVVGGRDKTASFYDHKMGPIFRYVKIFTSDIVNVDLGKRTQKGSWLKPCSKRKSKNQRRKKKFSQEDMIEQDDIVEEDDMGDGRMELKMISLWRKSYFTGPIADLRQHVIAALVM